MTNISTSEFYFAAWLFMNQVPLVRHIRENDRSTFTFESNNVDQLINEFYSETATVSVLPYTKAMREIKAIMYSGTIGVLKRVFELIWICLKKEGF